MIVVDEDQQLHWGWQTTVVVKAGEFKRILICLDWNSSFLEAQIASQMNLDVQRTYSMSSEVSINTDQ